MSNALFARLAAVLVFFGFIAFAVKEQRKQEEPPRNEEGVRAAEPSGGWRNPALLFTWYVLAGITGGLMAIKWLLPALGDKLGESLYSAPEKVEQDDTMRAMAMVSAGNYPKALEMFRKIREEKPQDRFAVVEMAKIHHEKLGDPDSAITLLEEAIGGEWPDDDKAFFCFKLAELYQNERHDVERAREMLNLVMSSFPGTSQAANARHRLNQIEEEEFFHRNKNS